MTTRSLLVEKPSISTSSWLSVCSRSELLSAPRSPPTASISSMKMIAGRCLRAIAKRRRMRAAPRPANISTNAAADCEKKFAPASWATALASSVLPVPGGPCSRIPRGTVAPSLRNRSGSRRNSTTSWSSAFASSAPATSFHPIAPFDSGLISVGFVFGISFSVRQRKKTSRPMKMIGAHVCSQVEIESHEYQAGPSGTWTCGVACASSAYSVASLPKCSAGVAQPTPRHNEVWTLVRVSGGLGAQDLGERGAADLELALVGLARADHALQSEAGLPDRAREPRLGVALAPREHLDRHGGGGEGDRPAGHRARPLERPAEQQRARDVGGEHRRDEVRAAALVLLGGVARVVGPLLVGGDRLVLDAVVGGELAAAQREQRRDDREERGDRLAARPAEPLLRERPGQRGAGRDADDGEVLERQPRGGQRALDERDHGQRLAEAHDPAHAGDVVGAAQAGLAPRGDLDLARGRAHGRRPVRRPVHEQPVAQRHPAKAQLLGLGGGGLVAHASSLLGSSWKNAAAKPRSRT